MLRLVNTSNGCVVNVNTSEINVDIEEVSSKYDILPAKCSGEVTIDGNEISIAKDDGLPLFVIRNDKGVITGILVRNEKEKETLIEKAEENLYEDCIIELYKEAVDNSIFFATDREDEAEVLSDITWLMMILSVKDDYYVS